MGTPAPAPVEPTPRLLLSLPEVEAALGVRRSTVYRLMARGELRGVKIGARCLVPMDELNDFVARKRSAAARGKA